jgi:addiction module HigA family antidote
MSRMHNPAHPGEVLREWLPEDMTVTQAAKELQVSRVTLSKVLNGKAGVTGAASVCVARERSKNNLRKFVI